MNLNSPLRSPKLFSNQFKSKIKELWLAKPVMLMLPYRVGNTSKKHHMIGNLQILLSELRLQRGKVKSHSNSIILNCLNRLGH